MKFPDLPSPLLVKTFRKRKINSATTSISQSISQSHLQLPAMSYTNIDCDTSSYLRRRHKQCAVDIDVRSYVNRSWVRKCVGCLFTGASITSGDCLRCGRKMYRFNRTTFLVKQCMGEWDVFRLAKSG